MKKKILLIVGVALGGIGILTLNSLHAQDNTTPPAAQAPPSGPAQPPPGPDTPIPPAAPEGPAQAPPSGPAQGPRAGMPPPGFRGRPGSRYRQTLVFLRMAKTDLENSKDDFDGHRKSAIEACDKAMKELESVQASIQASAAANKGSEPPPNGQQAPPSGPAPVTNPPQ